MSNGRSKGSKTLATLCSICYLLIGAILISIETVDMVKPFDAPDGNSVPPLFSLIIGVIAIISGISLLRKKSRLSNLIVLFSPVVVITTITKLSLIGLWENLQFSDLIRIILFFGLSAFLIHTISKTNLLDSTQASPLTWKNRGGNTLLKGLLFVLFIFGLIKITPVHQIIHHFNIQHKLFTVTRILNIREFFLNLCILTIMGYMTGMFTIAIGQIYDKKFKEKNL